MYTAVDVNDTRMPLIVVRSAVNAGRSQNTISSTLMVAFNFLLVFCSDFRSIDRIIANQVISRSSKNKSNKATVGS